MKNDKISIISRLRKLENKHNITPKYDISVYWGPDPYEPEPGEIVISWDDSEGARSEKST